jgi:prepilin-type N-terminal cleavage/methylation domain-containing protein
MIKNTRGHAKGFTLIELLVVIAIIGILSSVVLASLNQARAKSRDARRIADLKQIQTALELYYDANSSAYPVALSSLATQYIPTVPTDPTNTGSYVYSYQPISTNGADAICESYHLQANLENTTNAALTNDADVAAITAFGASSATCTGGTAFAAGTDPLYDVRP